jgi:hypothetical protein
LVRLKHGWRLVRPKHGQRSNGLNHSQKLVDEKQGVRLEIRLVGQKHGQRWDCLVKDMEGDRSVDHMAGYCSVKIWPEIGRSNKNMAGDEIVHFKIKPKMRFDGQCHMANLGWSKLGPV